MHLVFTAFIECLYILFKSVERGLENRCVLVYAYKVAEQSAHPHSLISVFGVRCFDSVHSAYILYLNLLIVVSRRDAFWSMHRKSQSSLRIHAVC